jgi:phage terminase large subunit
LGEPEPDLREAYARRLDYRLRVVGADPARRAAEWALCAADPAHWLTHWGWTFDPRESEPVLPFDPFPRQAEFLTWLTEREARREDGLVEKSRDMGVTWLCCAHALHGWLFLDGYQVGFGSRKLDLVDRRGDPNSIFEKLRFLLYNLPAWMRPAGFDPGGHDHEGRLVNPATGSVITGEGGDNIGRGGRASVYFLDEAAYLEHPRTVDMALSQTTNVRIDVSTPNGPGNPFYTRRHSGRVPVFTFHWRDDPRKGSDWYERECRRLGDPVVIAQELDIDYTASVEGILVPGAWVRAAVNLPLPPSGARPVAGWDVAEEGANRNVLVARRGPLVLPPLSWGQLNTTEGAWRAADEAERLGVSHLLYDCVGPGMGVKGAFVSGGRRLRFTPVPVNGGASPTEAVWPDGRTSRERFTNLRAELAWRLRARFEKAYEYRMEGRTHHRPEDMISIPDHPQLIAELSLPRYRQTDAGKVQLESKPDMRRRGVKSPDHFDGLLYCFAPLPAPAGAPAAGGTRPSFEPPGAPGRGYGGGW